MGAGSPVRGAGPLSCRAAPPCRTAPRLCGTPCRLTPRPAVPPAAPSAAPPAAPSPPLRTQSARTRLPFEKKTPAGPSRRAPAHPGGRSAALPMPARHTRPAHRGRAKSQKKRRRRRPQFPPVFPGLREGGGGIAAAALRRLASFCAGRFFYSAALAFSTSWAKPAGSLTAKSASTLRLSSTPDFLRPFMKRE